MKPQYLYTILASLLVACTNTPDSNPQATHTAAVRPDTIPVLAHGIYRRMVEDVPVEDRKYLTDTTLRTPLASKKKAIINSVITEHSPRESKKEVHTYFLIAGTFKETAQAQLLVNYFETEGLSTLILPHEGMQRVAIKLEADEDTARAQLDSLNAKYNGILEFWFYQG